MDRIITGDAIAEFAEFLKESEKSSATVEKYTHDITRLRDWLNCETVTSKRISVNKFHNLKKV